MHVRRVSDRNFLKKIPSLHTYREGHCGTHGLELTLYLPVTMSTRLLRQMRYIGSTAIATGQPNPGSRHVPPCMNRRLTYPNTEQPRINRELVLGPQLWEHTYWAGILLSFGTEIFLGNIPTG